MVLLTFTHDGLSSPVRVCSNSESVLSRTKTFLPFPFMVTLPDDMDGQPPRATLTIDAVDRSIIQMVRTLATPVDVLMEVVFASTPDTVEGSWPEFQLVEVEYNALTVSGSIVQTDFTREPYPEGRQTPTDFPGAV